MILLIRQYLAALRERRELDAILPDLLLQLGFQVYSRPGIGTRQDGVDVAAVGADDDGIKKVFLFSIKSGDLSRASWDDTTQGLRRSLNEILDAYIATRIPPKFRGLPIVICPCWGGNVEETVQVQLNGFASSAIERNKHLAISFDFWDGDKLADLIAKGFMREELMPGPLASSMRKAIALVEEPESACQHFSKLVSALFEKGRSEIKARETVMRQMTLCVWILYGWAIEAENLEAPQRSSELILLRAWELAKGHLSGKKKLDKSISTLLNSALEAYLIITDAYLAKVGKVTTVFHGLGTLVNSATAVDVNLKLFDYVGRASCFGLWQHALWQKEPDKTSERAKARVGAIFRCRDQLVQAIENNPALCTPLTDDQAIDINIAAIFLHTAGRSDLVGWWIGQMTVASIFAFVRHDRYPSRTMDYRELLSHPKARTEEYRNKVTPASILYPTLAIWAHITGYQSTLAQLSEFSANRLKHCNLQVMLPDFDTEDNLYIAARGNHGAVLGDLEITPDGGQPLGRIRDEVTAYDGLKDLSPVRFGLHALIVLACRNQRVPIPPQYWLNIIEDTEASNGSSSSPEEAVD